MRVTVNYATLVSVHSLGIGVSKDDVAPVITQIMLAREGDDLRAATTDRFMVLSGLYKNVSFEDWEDGEQLLIDPKALKSAVDLKKAGGLEVVPIDIDKDRDTGLVSAQVDAGTRVELTNRSIHVSGSFPPVVKLFPTDEANGASVTALRPEFLARLVKVLPPVSKPDRNRVWRFEFRQVPDSRKPEPVYATYSDSDQYRLESLIQPNVLVR
jgi:hypothetical protein